MTQDFIPPPPSLPEQDYQPPGISLQDIQSKLNGPGIALMVTAAIGFLFQLKSILVPVDTEQLIDIIESMNLDVDPDQISRIVEGMGAGNMLFVGLGLILTALVFYGGMKMRKMENWGLALAASIIALFPCTSPCCCLGLPLGIWALVVLLDSSVKDAFEHQKTFQHHM